MDCEFLPLDDRCQEIGVSYCGKTFKMHCVLNLISCAGIQGKYLSGIFSLPAWICTSTQSACVSHISLLDIEKSLLRVRLSVDATIWPYCNIAQAFIALVDKFSNGLDFQCSSGKVSDAATCSKLGTNRQYTSLKPIYDFCFDFFEVVSSHYCRCGDRSGFQSAGAYHVF